MALVSAPQSEKDDFSLTNDIIVKPQHSPHTSELIGKALLLFSRGASYKTVASSLSLSVYTVRDWYHRYRNGTLEEHIQGICNKARYSDAVRKQVVELRVEKGLSYNRIVEQTGVRRATVRGWLGSVKPKK